MILKLDRRFLDPQEDEDQGIDPTVPSFVKEYQAPLTLGEEASR